MPTSDEIIQQWLSGGGKQQPIPPTQKNFTPPPNTPAQAAPPPAGVITASGNDNPFNVQVQKGLAPGVAEGAVGNVSNITQLMKEEQDKSIGSDVAIQNLRNAAEIYSKINSGVTIPAQTELGRWMTGFGFDPKYFGLEQPQFAQEAKKAATLALYATMKTQPSLVGDMEARKFTSPEADLEPDALRNLIANSIYTLKYHSDLYKHMQDYAKEHNNNIYGYDPNTYKSSVDNAKMLSDIYNTLPTFKGEKTGATIGVPVGQTPPETTPPPTASQKSGLPEGAKLLGHTVDGKPVYLDPKTNKRIVIE